MTWDRWVGSMDGRPVLWIKHLWHWRGFRLDLHKFEAADDPDCFHTHPAWAVRLVVWGGYWEEMEDGRRRLWWPGRFGIVAPELCHRVAGLRASRSISLWFRLPVSAPVRLRGAGWAQQAQTHRDPRTVLDVR